MWKLVLAPWSPNQVVHEITGKVVTIGRAADNLVQIDDPSISSRHAQLHQAGESFHLQDLGSANGTRVNGEAVTSVVLHAGDRITFGKVEGSFEHETAETAAPSPVPPEAEAIAIPAEVSTRPADFANASPFPKRRNEKDPVRTALFAAAAIAILALLASLLALAQMRPPVIP